MTFPWPLRSDGSSSGCLLRSIRHRCCCLLLLLTCLLVPPPDSTACDPAAPIRRIPGTNDHHRRQTNAEESDKTTAIDKARQRQSGKGGHSSGIQSPRLTRLPYKTSALTPLAQATLQPSSGPLRTFPSLNIRRQTHCCTEFPRRLAPGDDKSRQTCRNDGTATRLTCPAPHPPAPHHQPPQRPSPLACLHQTCRLAAPAPAHRSTSAHTLQSQTHPEGQPHPETNRQHG